MTTLLSGGMRDTAGTLTVWPAAGGRDTSGCVGAHAKLGWTARTATHGEQGRIPLQIMLDMFHVSSMLGCTLLLAAPSERELPFCDHHSPHLSP
jgi:hypothetical protein